MSDTARTITCDSCLHLGVAYWDNGYQVSHHCLKSSERRMESFKSCGDASMDFMNDFRAFYDAQAGQAKCSHYEERPPISEANRVVLVQIQVAGGKKAFPFFSDGNRLCEKMANKFVKSEYQQDHTSGDRIFSLTKIGKFELSKETANAK